MSLEKMRGRYRLYRFPSRQQEPQSEDVTPAFSTADYQKQLMDGYQEGQRKGYEEGFAQGQEQGFSQGKSQGYQQGLSKGHTDGSLSAQKEGRQQFALAARPLEHIAAEVNDYLAHIQRQQRDDLLKLVEKVTRQVIRCELALQPTQLLSIVEEALAALPAMPESLQVKLSTEEFERIQNAAPEKVAQWGLIASSELQSGECQVITGQSELDVGCEHRLNQCMGALKEKLAPEPKDE